MGHLILMLQDGMTDFLEVTRIKNFLGNDYAALPQKNAENSRLAAHKARAAAEKRRQKVGRGAEGLCRAHHLPYVCVDNVSCMIQERFR